jgi:hypothetical protein
VVRPKRAQLSAETQAEDTGIRRTFPNTEEGNRKARQFLNSVRPTCED